MFRPARKSLRRVFLRLLPLVATTGLSAALLSAQEKTAIFRVIAIAEHGGIHKPFVDRACDPLAWHKGVVSPRRKGGSHVKVFRAILLVFCFALAGNCYAQTAAPPMRRSWFCS